MRSNVLPRLTALTLTLSLLAGCGTGKGGASIGGGLDIGPFEINVSVDPSGNVALDYGFTRKLRVSLGPVGFRLGLQQTVALTSSRRFSLFILTQDVAGSVQRDEYEIGRRFHVRFNARERVTDVIGRNDNLIVVVERSGTGVGPSNLTPPGFSMDGTWQLSFAGGTHVATLKIAGGYGVMDTQARADDGSHHFVRQTVTVLPRPDGMLVTCHNPVNIATDLPALYTPDKLIFRYSPQQRAVSAWHRDDVNTTEWTLATLHSFVRQ